MANLTDGAEENILDWYFRTVTAPTRPTAWYIALFTTAPTADAGTGGTEVAGSIGYSRQSVTFSRTNQTLNPSATVTFGPATSSWGTVLAFGIYSASSSGTLYAFANLTNSRTVAQNDTLTFATTDLSITLD